MNSTPSRRQAQHSAELDQGGAAENETGPQIELCCLLWARPGEAAGLTAYEDTVLAFVAEHDGVVVQRAVGDGADETPHETQLFRFQDQHALEAFLGDPRRQALSAERERVVARTELYPVRIAAHGVRV